MNSTQELPKAKLFVVLRTARAFATAIRLTRTGDLR